jgi:serine/threonine-protein kinase
MLTGVPAIAVSRERTQQAGREMYKNIRPILDLAPNVPLPFAAVVNKSLEFEPERRYQTPGDMLVDLKLAMKRVTAAKEGVRTEKELESKEGHADNGQPRKLMVVESDVKMQDMLRDLFKSNGYRVLVTSDPERVLERFFQDPKAADMILFSTINNGRAALEVFNRFGQELVTRDLPAVLLLDQNHLDWEREAQTAEHRAIARMPIKMRELREALVEVGAVHRK